MGIPPTRRKLQFAGNSSYVLTIPKQWIKKAGLQKENAEVLIEEMDDGGLRITPADGIDQKDSLDEQIIAVNENRSPNEVIRLILAAYLASTPQIIIKSLDDKPLQMEHVLAINEICDKLWGAEIIEETETKIVIHDALDPSQLKLQDLIQKSWFTAKNMIEKAYKYIFENEENAKSIVHNAEKTLDKLYYLALRQLYRASSKFVFATQIGIYPMEIIDYHLLVKNIERIGDHAEQLVSNKPNEIKEMEKLRTLAEIGKSACEEAVKAFLNDDPLLAQTAIDRKIQAKEISESYDIPCKELPLAKSILRIADYGSDIGELVINRFLAKKKDKEIIEFAREK